MATVIDSLIVTLGLDPKEFNKGQKDAAKALIETKNKTKTAADEMGAAVTSAARKFAVAFLGFESAAGLTRMLAGLNTMSRELGFIGANTNENVKELRNWANAAEVAGGSTEGLLSTVQAIQKEQSNFALTGESSWGPYLNALSQASGKALSLIDELGNDRSKLDILMDMADALERVSKLQGGRPRANSLGLAMGIDQGTLNFLLKGPAAIRGLLNQQRSGQFQVNDGMTAAADQLAGRFTLLKQHGESFGLALLEKLQPVLNKWADRLEKWLASIDLNKLSANIEALVQGLADVAGLLGDLVEFLAPIVKWVGTKIGESAGWTAQTWSKLFPDEETRKRNGDANRGYRRDPTLEALRRISTDSAHNIVYGKNRTIGDIVDSLGLASEEAQINVMSMLSGATGKNQEAKLTEEDYQRIGEVVKAKAAELGSKPQAPARTSALDSVHAVGAADTAAARVAGTVNYNQMQIDKIEVNTAATDATGIANGIEASLRRKNLITNADTGLS